MMKKCELKGESYMISKRHYATAIVLVASLVALLFGGGGPTTHAAPVAQEGTVWDSATVVGSNWRVLSEGQSDWYRIEYAGDNQPLRIWMDVVPAEGAGFHIWTADMLNDMVGGEEVDPLGSGTVNEAEPGVLFWQGQSPVAETYFIQVEQGWAEDVRYLLTFGGPGLAEIAVDESVLDTGTDVTATQGVTTADDGAVPGDQMQLVDPPVAEALSENWQTLQEDESHWYTFRHRGDQLPVHIWMDVDPNEGAGFRIFSEDEAMAIMDGANPNDIDDVGRGAPNELEPGHLFWRGAFENEGLYYVFIEHGWEGEVSYAIYAAGPGLGRVATQPAADEIDPATTQVDATTEDPAIAGAEGEDSGVLPGDQIPLVDPPVAEALGENWRTLQETESHWYTFRHRGNQLPVHIWMDIEPNEGAGFHVFNEDQAQAVMAGANPLDVNAVGRGTTNPIEPGYLFWRGTFENEGIYYVLVEHGWTGEVSYTLYAAGSGLGRLTAQAAAQQAVVDAGQTAAAADAPAPTTTDAAATAEDDEGTLPGDPVQLVDPPVAEALGQNWRTLQEDESHWYTFTHRGDQLPVHIWMAVEPNEGAGFRIFSEDEAMAIMDGGNPNDVDDVGRGAPNEIEPGQLFWRGTFENEGLYYVFIEHGWTGEVSYAIYAAGPGLGQ
jgi:hypothetical protein